MGELMIKNDDLAVFTQAKGIGDVLKPLIKEIHLFDTYVAGTTHLKDESVLDEIEVGQKLTLKREINKFDEKAIMLITEGGKKVGYVPFILLISNNSRRNDYGCSISERQHISFLAVVSDQGVQFVKQYSQGNAEAYFKKSRVRYIYAYCNHHGLFVIHHA